MDWEFYRNMLGNPINDMERFSKCINIVLNEVEDYFRDLKYNYYKPPVIISNHDYMQFCNYLGIRKESYDSDYIYQTVLEELNNRSHDFKTFIFSFVALINSISSYSDSKQPNLIKILEKAFNDSGIRFEVLKENNNYFLFPNGAKELDNALIVENLQWLKDYKKTHKIFTQTLLQHSQKDNPRDIADNLRKTLEQFLQEFFSNSKILSNNIGEVGIFFEDKKVHPELKNMFTSLIVGYDKANNGIAKHHDNINDNMLEFLLYQTGVFIRTLITLKKS